MSCFSGDALIVIWEYTDETKDEIVNMATQCAMALESDKGRLRVHVPTVDTLAFSDQLRRCGRMSSPELYYVLTVVPVHICSCTRAYALLFVFFRVFSVLKHACVCQKNTYMKPSS